VGPAREDERFAAGGGGYLCLKHVQRRARPAACDAPEAGSASVADLEEPEVEEPDPATLPADGAHDAMHVYEYHVVEICHPAR
jgi:hypothetical protein